jgi:sugar lactone lactonase YvrE
MQRSRAVLAALCVSLATMVAAPSVAAADEIAAPPTLTIPGDNFYPESIGAAANGDLYASSIVTGEIVRFKHASGSAQTFVPAGVNIGTAGVAVDDRRKVLWTCGVDLSFQTPTVLRAFTLATGAEAASYTLPDRAVCGDIAVAGDTVYVTDTTDPTASPALPAKIFRLTTPRPDSAAKGELAVWSTDPAFTGAGSLQINGIAFDGRASLYTSNYSTGSLVRVDIARDGSPLPAVVIEPAGTFTNPDGIRMLDRGRLLVTENPGRLSVVDVRTGAVTVVDKTLDQPTSVVRVGNDLWVTEGQVLRLQNEQPPNLPFTIRRVPAPR